MQQSGGTVSPSFLGCALVWFRMACHLLQFQDKQCEERAKEGYASALCRSGLLELSFPLIFCCPELVFLT